LHSLIAIAVKFGKVGPSESDIDKESTKNFAPCVLLLIGQRNLGDNLATFEIFDNLESQTEVAKNVFSYFVEFHLILLLDERIGGRRLLSC
jgi:hypothetical protein